MKQGNSFLAILSPSAWAVAADHDNTQEPYGRLWCDSSTRLARLYDLTVIALSNVGWITGGPWRSRQGIGWSLAVGTGGAILAKGPYGEDTAALVEVEVHLESRLTVTYSRGASVTCFGSRKKSRKTISTAVAPSAGCIQMPAQSYSILPTASDSLCL